MRIAHHASAAGLDHQGALAQFIQGLLDLALAGVHHRIAAGLLVAAGHQGIEAERIGVGNRVFFSKSTATTRACSAVSWGRGRLDMSGPDIEGEATAPTVYRPAASSRCKARR
jgi:hypothetical protein